MPSRGLLWAGVAGPLLFATVALAEGAARPGYDPLRNWISELALTGRGWIQIVNFLVTGVLLIAFAVGLRRRVRSGPAAVWGPRWVAATGVALVAAGVFVTDPGLDYPPGAAATASWHGALHDVAGAAVFLALALTAFTYARRFARPYGIAAGVAVIVLFLGAGTLVGLDYAGVWTPAPAGLLQRLSLFTGLAWLVKLAHHALTAERSARPAPVAPAGSGSR
ncbi:DUF998 domain-containing protein [Micromonospora echinaurantiaca]|uniref:DUF998 domain-containing protein n=1 Tax=Micromonospora echinaurantiaca TaxID=47857 RepID=UPI0037A4C5BD